MRFWLSFTKILDSDKDIKNIVELFLMVDLVSEGSKILFMITSMVATPRDSKLKLAHKDRNTRWQVKV